MADEIKVGKTTIRLGQGNIVEAGTEAIVNAANKALAGGGGVDGAIHRAAGAELYALTKPFRGCPTGSAVITTAGRIPPPVQYIIHAVGPIYDDYSPTEAAMLLNGAYRKSLELAEEKKLKSVAFPSISTGVYGYPIKEAAPVALRTALEYLHGNPNTSLQLILFVLFSAGDYEVYRQMLASLPKS